MAQNAQSAPKWDCHASPAGEWQCLLDGAPVPDKAIQPTPAKTPSKAAESAKVQAIPEPAPVLESPLQIESETPPAEIKREKQPATPEVMTKSPTQPAIDASPTVKATPVVKEASTMKAAPTKKTVTESISVPDAKRETVSKQVETTTQSTHIPLRIDRGLDWSQCHPHPLVLLPEVMAADDGSLHISSDGADLRRRENKAYFDGNIEFDSGNQHIEADHAEYDRNSGILDATGNIFFQQSNLRLTSSTITYDTQQKKGAAEGVEYRLLDRSARGHATTAQVDGKDLSSYQQVSYTTCRPGNEDWILKAAEMELNKQTGVGEAKDVKVSFKGVPFFYLPYITFPIDDRRKSGVLTPTIGSSNNTGIDISIPYYFNIAPQMDATVTPRIMSKRGLMLGGEFRYLASRFSGEVRGEVLPSDNEQSSSETQDRGALSLKARGNPADRWHFDFDINHVSDEDYLEDFGSSLAAISTRHQERRGDLIYQGDGWSFLGRLQNYQTIDKTIAREDRPYDRLPQLLVALERPNQAFGLTYHLQAEYVSFAHDAKTKVAGDRVNINPGISLPMRRSWGFLTPKVSLAHTTYRLDNQTVGADSSPNRTVPTFSLDSGLIFERDANLFGSALTQTLEPRLFYLYTSKEEQSEIPDFDTTEFDFSFANLFRENRFSGSDKIGDANQLTTALTSRFLDRQSGEELARASIGQIFYFRDREVQLQSATGATNDDSSSIVAEVSANLGPHWRAQAGVQWNPHTDNDQTEKSALGLHYRDEANRIFNATYRLTNGSIEQTDLSAHWPVSHNLSVVGRWNYSLLHEETMEVFGGVEYSNCCWTTRFVARDYKSSAEDTSNLTFFIQLELKGLTSIGDKVDKLLERGILGYSIDNE